MLTDFQNSFTNRFSSKMVAKQLNISQYRNEVTTSVPVNTGMDDRLWRANHLRISPCHPGQLSLLPSAGNYYQSNGGGALQLGSKGRHGSFHLSINVHGWQVKLCDSLLTRAIPKRFMRYDKALYKSYGYSYLNASLHSLPCEIKFVLKNCNDQELTEAKCHARLSHSKSCSKIFTQWC